MQVRPGQSSHALVVKQHRRRFQKAEFWVQLPAGATSEYVVVGQPYAWRMKVCSQCKRRRRRTSFNKKHAGKDGLQAVCRDCQHEQVAAWVRTSRGRKLCQQRRKKNRALLMEEVRRTKDCPCLDCGQSFHYRAMDFDHVRGEKKFVISDAVGRGGGTLALSTLRSEIAKCDVVCAVCHRMRTWTRIYGSVG